MTENGKKGGRLPKVIGLIVGLLVFGSCVNALGGDGDDTTQTAATSEPAQSRPSREPAASSAAPANPLATSENKLACSASRREVGEHAGVFAQISEGTATLGDGEKAALKLQQEMGKLSFATGDIGSELAKLSDAYGRMRVAIVTNDIDQLTRAVEEQNGALGRLDTLCTSIGE
jgi:hypothetical protein